MSYISCRSFFSGKWLYSFPSSDKSCATRPGVACLPQLILALFIRARDHEVWHVPRSMKLLFRKAFHSETMKVLGKNNKKGSVPTINIYNFKNNMACQLECLILFLNSWNSTRRHTYKMSYMINETNPIEILFGLSVRVWYEMWRWIENTTCFRLIGLADTRGRSTNLGVIISKGPFRVPIFHAHRPVVDTHARRKLFFERM